MFAHIRRIPDSDVPILLQSGTRCCPKTQRTEGSGDDRKVLEEAMNRDSRERKRRAYGRHRIHSDEYKANDQLGNDLTREWKAE